MKETKLYLLLFGYCLFLFPNYMMASSIFCLEKGEQLLLAKTAAWTSDFGYILVNQRNIEKEAFGIGFGENAKWVSKYGSVTFNHIAQELPDGGMNEAGLVIEVTSNNKIKSQLGNSPKISEVQWVQYNLDNYSTVQEVINNLTKIRVKQLGKGLVYFIADKSGSKAVVEMVETELTIYSGGELPIPAITNSLYEKCMIIYEHADLYQIDNPQNSINRFLRATKIVDKFEENQLSDLDYAFDGINQLKQNNSVWNIVYDLPNQLIYIETKAVPYRKWLNLKTIDFSCGAKNLFLDINDLNHGLVNPYLQSYSIEKNETLADKAYQALVADGSLSGFYRIMIKYFFIDRLKKYPLSLKCKRRK